MYYPVVVSIVLLLTSVTYAQKFHLMPKSIPRKTFVKNTASHPDAQHELVFAVQQKNLREMDKLLIERSTPGNPRYQEWLTFDQVGAMTSNPAGASAVEEWLALHNIPVTWKSAHSDYIKATAKISQWEQMLDTKFFVFEDHSRKGSMGVSDRLMHRAERYSLPDPMKEHLHAVFNTVQVPPVFQPKYYKADNQKSAQFKTQVSVRAAPSTTTSTAATAATGTTSNKKKSLEQGVVTVDFLNSFYEITTNTGSANMSQSVFETADESYSPTDLTQFQTLYNLPIQSALHPFGFNTSDCKVTDDDEDKNAADCYEGNLDVQYIMGVAQQTATIYWYVTDNSTTDPFVGWLIDVANTTNPPLVNSMSWGSLEQYNDPDVMDAFNTEAMKLGIQGVTVTVSSGDNGAAYGAHRCNVASGSADAGYWPGPTSWTGRGYFPSFPATSPYVTAVGATMGPESGNPEIACQSQLGGVITTGGGFSTYTPTPSWQQSAVDNYFASLSAEQTPSPGYNVHGRGYPDISMIGVWYQIIAQGEVTSLFGTSASSPVFAALLSLTNAARAQQGKSSVGFINPTLYAASSALYNDVTSGMNNCVEYGNVEDPSGATCCQSGFFAAPGWDPTTGFGSITYPNVLRMFDAYVAEPSAEPSAAPTNPTTEPTAAPTDPSAAPTAISTAVPSYTATTAPTYSVTISPTSAVPTALSTGAPTTTTTASPSALPTTATNTPTALPTTTPLSPVVSFVSNITLTGLSSTVLDSVSQSVVVQTTASAMGVPVTVVRYIGTIALSAPVPRVPVNNLRQSRLLQNTYSVIAVTQTSVALDQTTYSTTDALYTGLTNNLADSVHSGAYTTSLENNANAAGDATLQTASAAGVTSSTPTVLNAVSSDDDEVQLDGGAIAGIVIGSLAVIAFVAFLIYYCRTKETVEGRTVEREFSTSNPINKKTRTQDVL